MANGEAGAVAALYLRPAGSSSPIRAARIDALAGVGLDGDKHADSLSPRQVLLATTSAYASHALPPNTLRENILLDIDPAALAPGRLLAIGPQAVVSLSFNCEACGHLDMHRPGLSRSIGTQRGMLARVWRSGAIATGDTVTVLGEAAQPWADDWRERVAAILGRVPAGMVVEYRQLARLAGVQSSYCRVFPRIARDLGLAHKAVSMRDQATLARWEGYELFMGAGAPG